MYIREIENSMVRESFHDPRYDEPYFDPIEEECEERKYEDGDIVNSGDGTMRVISASWDDWAEAWLYECEPIADSEWAYLELYEYELSA